MISSKVMRDLVDEIRATPGFTAIQEGQHVKVVGPTGQTILRCGSSGSGRDDRDWRKQLKRYTGWPPTIVGEALSLAQIKAANSNGATELELPAQPELPTAPPARMVDRAPAPTMSLGRGKGRTTPSQAWTDEVFAWLLSLGGQERTIEEISVACPSDKYGIGHTSQSPVVSHRWLRALDGDDWLHITRRRVSGRTFGYRYSHVARQPERPIVEVEPEREPERKIEPHPAVVEAARAADNAVRAVVATIVDPPLPRALPDVFERVGAIDKDLLLRDENGDIWRARKGVS